MMVAKGSANVTITGCNDKRKITTTFVVTVSRKFLPIQLIYSGKTEPSRIPISWMLFNECKWKALFKRHMNHWSYLTKSLYLTSSQYISNYEQVPYLLQDNKMPITNIPLNMTKHQPLYLTVNGYTKILMARKFNCWYIDQVSLQLENGIPVMKINIKSYLSFVKSLHAK